MGYRYTSLYSALELTSTFPIKLTSLRVILKHEKLYREVITKAIQ